MPPSKWKLLSLEYNLTFLLINPLQIYFLCDSSNVYGASEGMSVLPSFCITSLKIILYVRQMRIIRELLHDIKKNVTEQCQSSRKSAEIFAGAEQHLKILTLAFLLSLISCIIFYCIVPYGITLFKISTGRDFEFVTPLSVKFPFNIAYHPVFEILFFVCGSSVVFMAMEMISMDTLFVGLLLFTRAHFTDLIERIKRTAEETASDDEMGIHNSVRECIAYHKQIIDYAERIQQAMSVTIFVQYVGSTLLLCMIIFQTTLSTRIDNLPVYASFLSGCITQLFMYSFYGTILSDEGLLVAHSICTHFNWYQFSPRNRKLLLLFIQRAQKPVQLTGMKVFDCSLDTFMKVGRSGWWFDSNIFNLCPFRFTKRQCLPWRCFKVSLINHSTEYQQTQHPHCFVDHKVTSIKLFTVWVEVESNIKLFKDRGKLVILSILVIRNE